MEPEQLRSQLEGLTDDFERIASKRDEIVPHETVNMVKALLDEAKAAVPDNSVVQAVTIRTQATYRDLYPLLRQVALSLPSYMGIG